MQTGHYWWRDSDGEWTVIHIGDIKNEWITMLGTDELFIIKDFPGLKAENRISEPE